VPERAARFFPFPSGAVLSRFRWLDNLHYDNSNGRNFVARVRNDVGQATAKNTQPLGMCRCRLSRLARKQGRGRHPKPKAFMIAMIPIATPNARSPYSMGAD
jgi:hypothetical protein